MKNEDQCFLEGFSRHKNARKMMKNCIIHIQATAPCTPRMDSCASMHEEALATARSAPAPHAWQCPLVVVCLFSKSFLVEKSYFFTLNP